MPLESPAPAQQFPTGQQAPAPSQNQNPEPPDQWREEVKKLVTQRDEFKSKFTEAAAKAAAYEATQAAQEADRAARREAEEQKSMIEQGKTKELLKMTEDKWRTELDRKERMHVEELVPLYIQAAARQIPNLVPGSEKDLAKLIRDDFKRENGKLVVYENGVPKKNDQNQDYDPIQYVIDQAKSRPHMLIDSMPASHGAPRSSNPANMPRSIGDMDKEALEQKAAQDPAGFKQDLRSYAKELAAQARAGKFKK